MNDIGPKTRTALVLISIGIAGCIGSALAHSTAGSVMSIIAASFGIMALL
jgi:hypothetical protein